MNVMYEDDDQVVGSTRIGASFQSCLAESFYWHTLLDVVDLMRKHGYNTVLSDLELVIAEDKQRRIEAQERGYDVYS